jgi:hypothetical protein
MNGCGHGSTCMHSVLEDLFRCHTACMYESMYVCMYVGGSAFGDSSCADNFQGITCADPVLDHYIGRYSCCDRMMKHHHRVSE